MGALGVYRLTITVDEADTNEDATIKEWTPMKHGPTVVTGTYDGEGDPRCLLNWGVSASIFGDDDTSTEDMADAYMNYFENMYGDEFFEGMDFSDSDSDTGLDDPGSTFLIGVTKDGAAYTNALKGYIQRITILKWTEE
jgi:hypothetical protein